MKESFSSLRQLEHHDNDLVRVYNNIQTDDYPEHWNNAFEIIVPVENSYEVVINGVVYDVWEDEVLIIPAGTVHEIFAPESGRRYIIMAEPRLFYSIEGLTDVQHCFYPCVHLRHDRHAELLETVRSYIGRVIEGYETDACFSRAEARLWLGMVFVKIARSLLGDESSTERREGHRQQTLAVFMDVCTYIARHCATKLTRGRRRLQRIQQIPLCPHVQGVFRHEFLRFFPAPARAAVRAAARRSAALHHGGCPAQRLRLHRHVQPDLQAV